MNLSILGLVAFATLVLGIPVTKREATPLPLATVDYRIPKTILPSSYSITIRPYLHEDDNNKRFTFDGECFIIIKTNESGLKNITLHSKNLTYDQQQSQLYQTNNPTEKIQILSHGFDESNDKFTLSLNSVLVKDTNYTLRFNYTGVMGDDMHGFYKSSYVDSKNNTKWIGSTQFETNHARRAFPCFDEPWMKAQFNLTILADRTKKVVSNTRQVLMERVDNANSLFKHVFAPTPLMSTYLLAFLVSDFNERSDGDFNVVARPEYYSQTEYSFDVGRMLLVEFDNYTKLPFYETGVDKMHLAAIPDFSAGAMENWGLLTYRERSLLYDEGSTTLSAKQSIGAVIAHEQAHMWFGDLVTCEWWSYTWLNEGFARYFQYIMTSEVHPEMELEKQFVVDQIHSVFTMDSTNATNPMTDITAASPSDLSRMFNSISYNKGGSVIRMIRHAMGEEAFQKSLQEYLNENQHKSTRPDDLFKHWRNNWPGPEKNKTLGEKVMRSFTEKVGYPVVYVELASDSKSMTLSQKRFLLKPGDGSDETLLYTIPFTFTTNKGSDFNNTAPFLYIEENTNNVTVSFNEPIAWVIGNIQETGYYRVNYSVSEWHKLHQALSSEKWSGIHELNRAQYVDDLLALSRAGGLTYEHSLQCLDYLESETNYLPWTAAFNGFDFLAARLGVKKENFAYYVTKISKKAYDEHGFQEDTKDEPLKIYARSKFIAWNCKYGHGSCISEALKLFRNMDSTPVPVNIRGAVYCTAMREGSANDFDKLYNKMKTEKVPTELVLIINNLGCVKAEALVKKYFDIILGDEIRLQDKSSALQTLYTENAENVSPVFDLVTESLEKMASSMGYSSVATVISNIASRFTTKEEQKKLNDFIANHGSKFGTSEATLKKAAKTVEENLDWSGKRLPAVEKYLQDYRNGAISVSISAFSIVLVAIVSFLLN